MRKKPIRLLMIIHAVSKFYIHVLTIQLMCVFAKICRSRKKKITVCDQFIIIFVGFMMENVYIVHIFHINFSTVEIKMMMTFTSNFASVAKLLVVTLYRSLRTMLMKTQVVSEVINHLYI